LTYKSVQNGAYGTGNAFTQAGGMNYSLFNEPRRLPLIICENTDITLDDPNLILNDTVFVWLDKASNVHGGRAAVCFLDGHAGTVPGLSRWCEAKWPDGEWIYVQGFPRGSKPPG
jgi:prepilin-type processing-associated H-X9-DG protein